MSTPSPNSATNLSDSSLDAPTSMGGERASGDRADASADAAHEAQLPKVRIAGDPAARASSPSEPGEGRDSSATASRTDPSRENSLGWGTILSILSALGYTAANIMLRAAVESDPCWVTAVKALPTVLLAGIWLIHEINRGKARLSANVVWMLIWAGLLGQLAGNVLFQWALGQIGIALTVPLCLGTIILSSALVGRVWLGEAIGFRNFFAMLTLTAAIWVLSWGASSTGVTLTDGAGMAIGWSWTTGLAVLAACISGLAYAVLGAAIRVAVTRGASVAATTFTTALVGVVSLGLASVMRLGWAGTFDLAAPSLERALLAGLFNFVAFVALTKALQITNLLHVNVLNGSQVAMAAIAGVILFSEPASPALGCGIVLTVAGLALMPHRGGS